MTPTDRDEFSEKVTQAYSNLVTSCDKCRHGKRKAGESLDYYENGWTTGDERPDNFQPCEKCGGTGKLFTPQGRALVKFVKRYAIEDEKDGAA